MHQVYHRGRDNPGPRGSDVRTPVEITACEGDFMVNTRRRYFNRFATLLAAVTGAPVLFAQQPPAAQTTSPAGNILVTDPFEKHVTRTMDALKKSVERAGCTMDSIIHLEVFLCLPHADSVPMPTGKARFDAHKAQYDALNKIYGTYFSQGKAPSRACMALEWIPGDSLIEIVGSALVVSPTPAG
jgi:enamine deaminase RidA (YjgF/YER057c/UK114 family)